MSSRVGEAALFFSNPVLSEVRPPAARSPGGGRFARFLLGARHLPQEVPAHAQSFTICLYADNGIVRGRLTRCGRFAGWSHRTGAGEASEVWQIGI